jgi:hypothetical protein
MEVVMGFLRALAGSLVRDVVAPELEALGRDLGAKVLEAATVAKRALQSAEAAVAEVRLLRQQMAAAMALDVSFKEAGKVIILTRIGDQDRVKFLDIKPEMTALEYKALVERLKEDFGVGDPVWIDKPMGVDDVFIGLDRAPRVRRGVSAVR